MAHMGCPVHCSRFTRVSFCSFPRVTGPFSDLLFIRMTHFVARQRVPPYLQNARGFQAGGIWDAGEVQPI